jgi:hypothetical protein
MFFLFYEIKLPRASGTNVLLINLSEEVLINKKNSINILMFWQYPFKPSFN